MQKLKLQGRLFSQYLLSMIHALNQGLKCCLLLLSCSLTNRCLTFTHPLLCFVLSHSICLFSEKSGLVHLSLGKLSQVKQGDNDLMTMLWMENGNSLLSTNETRTIVLLQL